MHLISSESEKNIEDLSNEIDKVKGNIKKLEELISGNQSSESERLKRAESLKSFSRDIHNVLREYKKQTYSDFANRLEQNATDRFQQLMQHNIAKDHKISVNLKERTDGNFEFKIDVLNKYNELQDQAGGADQALRRVSVIFALVDIAENKNGFPFIADAPTSRLSTDNKTEFFLSLLNDSSLKQSIILTMDLVSALETQKQNKIVLNSIGKKVLSELEKHDDARMMTIYNNSFEHLKNK